LGQDVLTTIHLTATEYVMSDGEKKNVIGGDVTAKAEVTEGKVNKPGALVEDSSLSGLTSGGVAPKDPSGHVTEGEATDKRENP